MTGLILLGRVEADRVDMLCRYRVDNLHGVVAESCAEDLNTDDENSYICNILNIAASSASMYVDNRYLNIYRCASQITSSLEKHESWLEYGRC